MPPSRPPQPIHTREQHMMRHQLLHRCLEELYADYLAQHPAACPRGTSVAALLAWSRQQQTCPDGAHRLPAPDTRATG